MQPVRMPTSREFEAMATRMYIEAVNAGRCPKCGGPIERMQRARCCTNAMPCGHRLFGKLRPMWLTLAVPTD